jgi:hypothetical protein
MKTAILLSGHIRSFERCLPGLHWFVFRHFPGADFFVSTEPDEDAPKAELLRAKYPDAKVSIDTTPQPAMVFPPEWITAAAHAPYAISVPVEHVVGQLWRLNRCLDHFIESAGPSILRDYDTVVRCRPDLWFHSFTKPPRIKSNRARTPWWGRFGGVNDRFAVLGMNAAMAYFSTYRKIGAHLAAGCPLHPESLIRASLEGANAAIDDTMRAEFSTLRANGETRNPEVSVIDLAHARM